MEGVTTRFAALTLHEMIPREKNEPPPGPGVGVGMGPQILDRMLSCCGPSAALCWAFPPAVVCKCFKLRLVPKG